MNYSCIINENHYIWSFSNFSAMLNFFYDSLDTLKKVKKPTRKEVQTFLLQVVFVIIVGSIVFLVFDNVRGNLYKTIFSAFSGT